MLFLTRWRAPLARSGKIAHGASGKGLVVVAAVVLFVNERNYSYSHECLEEDPARAAGGIAWESAD